MNIKDSQSVSMTQQVCGWFWRNYRYLLLCHQHHFGNYRPPITVDNRSFFGSYKEFICYRICSSNERFLMMIYVKCSDPSMKNQDNRSILSLMIFDLTTVPNQSSTILNKFRIDPSICEKVPGVCLVMPPDQRQECHF